MYLAIISCRTSKFKISLRNWTYLYEILGIFLSKKIKAKKREHFVSDQGGAKFTVL